MAGVDPEGEALRSAIKWISERRQMEPGIRLKELVEEAALRFDLSPLEAEWLWNALIARKG